MTAAEIAQVKHAIRELHAEAHAHDSWPMPVYATAALALLNLQIPDENRAPPVYPTGLYE